MRAACGLDVSIFAGINHCSAFVRHWAPWPDCDFVANLTARRPRPGTLRAVTRLCPQVTDTASGTGGGGASVPGAAGRRRRYGRRSMGGVVHDGDPLDPVDETSGQAG